MAYANHVTDGAWHGAWLLVVLLAAGYAAGILSGLLGLGGMSVYVPLLLLLLRAHYPLHVELLSAVLINAFAVTLVVGLGSWFAHHHQKSIDYTQVSRLAAGSLLGALAGFTLALQSGLMVCMDVLFGAYLLIVGTLSLVQRLEAGQCQSGGLKLFGIGLLGGGIGGLVGFNGSSVVIPLLRKSGLSVKQSMATASLNGLAVCLVLVVYLGLAFDFQRLDPVLSGLLAVAGLAGSRHGARLKHRASLRILSLAFSACCWTSGCVLLSRVAP